MDFDDDLCVSDEVRIRNMSRKNLYADTSVGLLSNGQEYKGTSSMTLPKEYISLWVVTAGMESSSLIRYSSGAAHLTFPPIVDVR